MSVSLVIITIFAIGIELVQLQINRTSELSDIRRDMVGAFLGYIHVFRFRGHLGTKLVSLLTVAIVLFIFELSPLAKSVIDEINIQRDKTALSNLEYLFEEERWIGNSTRFISEEFVSDGDNSLRVEFNTDKYSGVFLRYMHRDWREKNRLHFDVYYPDHDDLLLQIRISDYSHVGNNRYHDRYNKEIQLRSGWNKVEISIEEIKNAPSDRLIDLENIESVGMFVVEQPEAKTIYIDNVYLSQCCRKQVDKLAG